MDGVRRGRKYLPISRQSDFDTKHISHRRRFVPFPRIPHLRWFMRDEMATPSSVFLRQKKSSIHVALACLWETGGNMYASPFASARSEPIVRFPVHSLISGDRMATVEGKKESGCYRRIDSLLFALFFAARRSQMDVLANTGVVTKIAPLSCHCSFPSCLSFNFPFQLLENEREEGAKTSKWDQFFREVNYGF